MLSPLVHLSIVFTAITLFSGNAFNWRLACQGFLPTILGFGLTAYVLIFTLIGGDLHRTLATGMKPDQSASYLSMINSTFFHALFFQIITLIYSYVSSTYFFYKLLNNKIVLNSIDGDAALSYFYTVTSAFGYFLTYYSIMLLFSTSIAVFRLARATERLARATPVVPDVIGTDEAN